MFASQTSVLGLAMLTAGALVYGLVMLILDLRPSGGRRVARRLTDDLGMSEDELGDDDVLLEQDERKHMARWIAASQKGTSFRKVCDQAAVPWPAHRVMSVIAAAAALILLISVLVGLHPVTIAVATCLTVGGPIGGIYYMRAARLKKLSNQMPDALAMLSQSLRAGHSLPAGIELVADELPAPISTEFRRVHIEQQLGVRLEEALDHMAERVDLLDVRMFVGAVHIQRQTGGDLTEIMDRLAAVIRDRIKLLGQVRALTAEGRLSGWILVAIPMVLLVFILRLNPKHALTLIHSNWGQLFMAIGVVMQITGIILIRRIVNIKI